MGRIVIHTLTNGELTKKRQQDFLKFSYAQRFQKAIDLMRAPLLFNAPKNKRIRNKIYINTLISEKEQSARPKDKLDAEALKKIYNK